MKSTIGVVMGLLAVGCATSHSAAPHAAKHEGAEVLPFIENDYSRALAQAQATHRPLFVDAWAPW